MAFIKKYNENVITIDAILTVAGKDALNNGTFNIDNYKLGDDEIDYSKYVNEESESLMAQLPIFEGFYASSANLIYPLTKDSVSYSIISNINTWNNTDSQSAISCRLTDDSGNTLNDVIIQAVLESNNFADWTVNGVALTSSNKTITLTNNSNIVIFSPSKPYIRSLNVKLISINYDAPVIERTLSTNYTAVSDGTEISNS